MPNTSRFSVPCPGRRDSVRCIGAPVFAFPQVIALASLAASDIRSSTFPTAFGHETKQQEISGNRGRPGDRPRHRGDVRPGGRDRLHRRRQRGDRRGGRSKTARDGHQGPFLPLNVSLEADWQRAVKQIEDETGGLDILVNNAGINIRKVIEEISAEGLDQMYNVNVKGPFLGIKYALPVMKKIGGGSIINMSSVCGLIGHMYTPEAYTTTKGAVSLTRAVASRYGKFNIRCNSINPSTADTPLVREMLKDPERKKERLGEVPLGRMASMQDIAEAALYLMLG